VGDPAEGAEAIADLVGAMQAAGDDPTKIYDGLKFALPALLPDTLHAELDAAGKTDAFIREAYDDAVGIGLPNDAQRIVGDIYENPLTEWNWATRYYIAEQLHATYHRNPDARAVNHLAYFAVGEGFQLVTYHPDIEERLDAFIDHPYNRLRQYESQAAIDLLLDGELVIRWYGQGSEEPYIVPQKPWDLRGIQHELDNPRALTEFWIVKEEDTGDVPWRRFSFEFERIPADEITFVVINNHAYEVRGRSELYNILPWLKARKEWLENRARINYWLSVITWHIKIDAANPAVMDTARARFAKPPEPNSTVVTPATVEVEPITASPDAQGAKEDGHQFLLQIAKGLHLPEYFLGDGQNANLATATRQQLPALVKFEWYQRILIRELWRPLFRKFLELEVAAGRLPEEIQKHDGAANPIDGEMMPTIEAFEVSYKPVVDADLLNLTNALEKQVANEFTSTRQARLELGVDPDRIEEEIAEEREQRMRDIDAGLIPRPPEMRDVGLDDDEGADTDDSSDRRQRQEAPE